jgi:hypothetical protein
MVLANLYILGWNYEKWKYILPFNRPANDNDVTNQKSLEAYVHSQESAGKRAVFFTHGIRLLYGRVRIFFKRLLNDKFPTLFFAGVLAALVVCAVGIPSLYQIKPRNTLAQCVRQFRNTDRTQPGENFCNCIHKNGEPLDNCMNEYFNAPNDANQTP